MVIPDYEGLKRVNKMVDSISRAVTKGRKRKAWSEEAREAAAEARRGAATGAKPGGARKPVMIPQWRSPGAGGRPAPRPASPWGAANPRWRPGDRP